MFDVNGVSEKIRNARIKKNMTQSSLADELGVSFQAISNWERGNSLPDISKYEDLCRILDINLEELLGFGAESKTISKILKRKNHEETAPVTVEEIVPIAPILPPEDLKDTLKIHKEQCNTKTGLKKLLKLFPFLDQQTIDIMVEDAVLGDISELIAAAPFLTKENMRKLLEGWQKNKPEDKKVSPGSLTALAPFLDREMFDMLLDHVEMGENDINQIIAVAPFLTKENMRKLLEGWQKNKPEDKKVSPGSLAGLAPFLDRKMFEMLLDHVEMEENDIHQIMALAPFASKKSLKKLLEKAGKI